jgi:ribose 5-phosphate isomerase B
MSSSKIGIAADHGGYDLKTFIADMLRKEGVESEDFGNFIADENDDYPDFVIPMAQAISKGRIKRGIALCGSGVGACIAANKVKGVRACLVTDNFSAHQGVEDDDLNLICLGGRITGSHLAWEIVKTFLEADFTGEDRHKRRLLKISALEDSNSTPGD